MNPAGIIPSSLPPNTWGHGWDVVKHLTFATCRGSSGGSWLGRVAFWPWPTPASRTFGRFHILTHFCFHWRAWKQWNVLQDRDGSQRRNRPPPAGRLSATQPAPPKRRAGPGPPLLAQPSPGSPSQEKQVRIRQILGIGQEYGPDAAPESLLSALTRTQLS